MFRNLIFDWSGTLVDDLGPVLDATNAVLGRYGLAALDREEFRRRFRLPYREFYAECLPEVSIEELEMHFRPAFAESEAPVFVLPHAREKLEWCAQRGIRTFVLSSMDAEAFQQQLKQFGLEQHFEATYAGVADKRELIHEILARHGLRPEETAFVGDMTHDIETARHGGVASIAVLTGYTHAEPLAAARPDLTVPDLAVLRKLMERQPLPKPMMKADAIEIHQLRVKTFIGVPDEERAEPQELLVSLWISLSESFESMDDDISRTLDYYQLTQELEKLALKKPRKLIETLAADFTHCVLEKQGVAAVEVLVEKFILPQTRCVAVRMKRKK